MEARPAAGRIEDQVCQGSRQGPRHPSAQRGISHRHFQAERRVQRVGTSTFAALRVRVRVPVRVCACGWGVPLSLSLANLMIAPPLQTRQVDYGHERLDLNLRCRM